MFKRSTTQSYMIINGINTKNYGIYIQDPLPPLLVPEKRFEEITIPGRSGTLTVWDGAYENISKSVSVWFNGEQVRLVEAIAFLRTASTVTFSNEPDKVYTCRLEGTIQDEQLSSHWHAFTFNLICHPIKRQKDVSEIPLQSGTSLTNLGNVTAFPNFHFKGVFQDITLEVGKNQKIFIRRNALGNSSPISEVILDGSLMECYIPGLPTLSANNAMEGNFPCVLENEEVNITFSGAQSLYITPNWGWV